MHRYDFDIGMIFECMCVFVHIGEMHWYDRMISMGVYGRVRVHCVRRIVAPASGSLQVNGSPPLARRVAAAATAPGSDSARSSLSRAGRAPVRAPVLLLNEFVLMTSNFPWRWRKYTGHSCHLGPCMQRDSPRQPAPLASCPLAAWCSAGGGSKAKSVCRWPKSRNPPLRY